MSTYYVSSVIGSDANNGTTWALSKATITGALAVATATGDIIYVDSAHSFAGGGTSIVLDVATAGQAIVIISVNRAGSTTTGHSGWLAGAKESVGSSSSSVALTLGGTRNGIWFIFGVYFESNSGSGVNGQVALTSPSFGTSCFTLVGCTLSTPGSASADDICFGSTGSGAWLRIRLYDSVLIAKNSAAAGSAVAQIRNCDFFASGLSVQFSGASKPPGLFKSGGASVPYCTAEIIDSDLSGYNASAGVLLNLAAWVGPSVRFINCKLSSAVSHVGGTWANNAAEVYVIDCDSADTHNVFSYYNRLGTLLISSSIYANSGAQFDAASLSWQIVTTSLCNEAEPFTTPWLHKWGSSLSAQTASLEVNHDSATALHDRNCWAEFEYLSNASFPQGTLLRTRNSQPFDGSSSNLAAGAASWTGTGGFSNPNPQKVSAAFTPAEKSLLRARFFVGVASKTLYLDPLLRVV